MDTWPRFIHLGNSSKRVTKPSIGPYVAGPNALFTARKRGNAWRSWPTAAASISVRTYRSSERYGFTHRVATSSRRGRQLTAERRHGICEGQLRTNGRSALRGFAPGTPPANQTNAGFRGPPLRNNCVPRSDQDALPRKEPGGGHLIECAEIDKRCRIFEGVALRFGFRRPVPSVPR